MNKSESYQHYLNLADWARRRYTSNNGRLLLTVKGRPSRYSRITEAAYARYVR